MKQFYEIYANNAILATLLRDYHGAIILPYESLKIRRRASVDLSNTSIVSGFQSKIEEDVLHLLLKRNAKIILVMDCQFFALSSEEPDGDDLQVGHLRLVLRLGGGSCASMGVMFVHGFLPLLRLFFVKMRRAAAHRPMPLVALFAARPGNGGGSCALMGAIFLHSFLPLLWLFC